MASLVEARGGGGVCVRPLRHVEEYVFPCVLLAHGQAYGARAVAVTRVLHGLRDSAGAMFDDAEHSLTRLMLGSLMGMPSVTAGEDDIWDIVSVYNAFVSLMMASPLGVRAGIM